MGLDNFWELPDGSEPPDLNPPLNLCGGMFSGHGGGSFRGKVYNGLIEEITGVSLYQDKIDNDTIIEMALALSEVDPGSEVIRRHSGWDTAEDEFKDLVRMFMTYAEMGAVLRGWW